VNAPDALVWDVENLRHLGERNAIRLAAGEPPVMREDVDAVYESADYTTRHVEYLTRTGEWEWQVHLIGRTPVGRFLTLVCQMTDGGRFRPITVWPCSDSEVALFWNDQLEDE
jgi:hypothetical protein